VKNGHKNEEVGKIPLGMGVLRLGRRKKGVRVLFCR
jgi:hypothetical protein